MKIDTLILTVTAAAVVLVSPVLRAETDTDHRIEQAAKNSYNYRTVLEDHVKIEAEDGVVTLTGTVKEADHRRLAEDTVVNLPGVVRVDNRIEVKNEPTARSDEWIALKARGRLLVKANVSVANTDVTVHNGVVTLTGKADSLAQKELTEMYVQEVEGVKAIDNQIVVVKNPEPDRTAGEVVDDASITAQIKYALLTNRATSALKTSVDTRNGNVVVRGEASSAAEKALVTRLAQAVRGVVTVENEMTVEPAP